MADAEAQPPPAEEAPAEETPAPAPEAATPASEAGPEEEAVVPAWSIEFNWRAILMEKSRYFVFK